MESSSAGTFGGGGAVGAPRMFSRTHLPRLTGEVREGLDGRFVFAVSPYPISAKGLRQEIFVRAVDKSGNELTESVFGPYYKQHTIDWRWIITMLIGITVACWCIRKIVLRSRKI